MGKVRTRVLGNEEEEKKQIEEQKKKSVEKKASQKKEVVEKETDDKKVKAVKSKKAAKITIQRERQRGKKYAVARKNIERSKTYSLDEAITVLKKIKYAKFDEAVEIHINLDKTGLKGEVELPHSTGKTTKVTIVNDKVLEDIEKGVVNFDILVTHPSYMPKLARFAKVLGPRGLMPNPKAGTISDKPEEIAKKFEKGMLRWKSEAKFPLLHQMIGKVSFDNEAIKENALTLLKSVGKVHIQKAVMKTTMSPGLKIDTDLL